MACSICTHPQRAEIEQLLLDTCDVESVAKQFDVNVDELTIHALRHVDKNHPEDSIARNIHKHEADLLIETAEGYRDTFEELNATIINILADPDPSAAGRCLTRPIVDLYLGAGREIRETVKAIAELDQLLNGPKDENVSGLAALAEAIRGSK